MKRTGVLLVNLGTPDAPTPEAVGRYLREFLMDGFVIDVPAPLRWFLVNVMIVPKRKIQSALLYQKVQTPDGSPLLANTRDLAGQVRNQLAGRGGEFHLEFAMRYGNPSIAQALKQINAPAIERIVVAPLYPQYAESSYRTAVVEIQTRARELGCLEKLKFLPPFYDRVEFIQACAQRVAESIAKKPTDHLLFSFHSLPERQIKKLDRSGEHCLVAPSCCDRIEQVNRDCYRAQCIFTARAIASELGLAENSYSISFQSRLGRAKWLGPQTEDVLGELARQGIARRAVFCPSFVADCLETLEEIAIRGRKTFLNAGGAELDLIPALNSHPQWVTALSEWLADLADPGSRTLAPDAPHPTALAAGAIGQKAS